METRIFTQPLLRCVFSKPCLASTTRAAAATTTTTSTTTQRRHQSSTSRTKRALKIPPHPSFLTGGGVATDSPQVIYNPPSSTPSVYHTPFKFLPRSDPRRQANISQLLRSASPPTNPAASASADDPSSPLAPELKQRPQMYNVTPKQVEEMRALRAQDPARWGVLALARRYECAPLFVMMCCRAAPDHRARERERLDAVKARWGPIRTAAREERRKRKDLLLKGAL